MNYYQREMQIATEIKRYTREFFSAHLVQLMADIVRISFDTLYNFRGHFCDYVKQCVCVCDSEKANRRVFVFLNHTYRT